MILDMKVVDINGIDSIKWNRFVEKHPLGNIFQTEEMYEVYCHTSNSFPVVLAVEDYGVMKGLLLAVVITNGGRLLKPLTARSIIYGGPLVVDNDEKTLELLLTEYKKRLPWYVVYSEIRPVYNLQPIEKRLMLFGFERVGHYNIMLNINKDESVLWEQLHKERRRNISCAEKKGLTFKEVELDDEIMQITRLIERTYERKKVPMSNSDMFIQLKQIMKQRVHFFAAFFEGKMIAGQVRLCYNDLVYAWYAGSDDSYLKLRPNDFLMWNVILWAHEKGFRVFDFGGGGEPGVPYGVRDYKLKYGCELHEFGRFIYKHHHLIYSIGKLYAQKVIIR